MARGAIKLFFFDLRIAFCPSAVAYGANVKIERPKNTTLVFYSAVDVDLYAGPLHNYVEVYNLARFSNLILAYYDGWNYKFFWEKVKRMPTVA